MILGIQWSTILCALEYLRMVDVNNSIQWPSGVYEAKHLSKCVPENTCPQLASRRIQKDRNAAFIAYICPKIDPLSMANAKVQCSKSSLINNTESPEEAEVSRNSTFPKRVDSLWKVGANVSGDGGIENAVANAASIGSVMHRLFPCYQNFDSLATFIRESSFSNRSVFPIYIRV